MTNVRPTRSKLRADLRTWANEAEGGQVYRAPLDKDKLVQLLDDLDYHEELAKQLGFSFGRISGGLDEVKIQMERLNKLRAAKSSADAIIISHALSKTDKALALVTAEYLKALKLAQGV